MALCWQLLLQFVLCGALLPTLSDSLLFIILVELTDLLSDLVVVATACAVELVDDPVSQRS